MMRLNIRATIDRRILINYQVEREVLERFLPAPFKPQLVEGKGIAGICLIRLKDARPKGLPRTLGITSENGAHRIAVEWTESGELKSGVFVPRRDTSSRLASIAGGLIFPGIYHNANFDVQEGGGEYEVGFVSADKTSLNIKAKETSAWNTDSVFENLDCVSNFFERGSVGYSPQNGDYEGIELNAYSWKVSLLDVESVSSSFFEDKSVFPSDSVVFDNALLMKNIEHEWVSLKKLRASS